jgi:hypothetical protein
MASNKDLSISRQAPLPQLTLEPPPPPSSPSAQGNKYSISSFMENEHLKEQSPGSFVNTQNPAMKFSLDGQNQQLRSPGSFDDLLASQTPDPYGDGEQIDSDNASQSAINDLSVAENRSLSSTDRRRNDEVGRRLLVPHQSSTPPQPRPDARPKAPRSLANRAVVNQQPKKHTYPKSKALVGVVAGGAAGAATGALAAGGVAGLTALGAAVSGGLIGAAVGSTVPIVGTVIGAAVGVALGIAWGIRAKARQADMLDTKTRSWARTCQRHPAFAWARALDPVKLLKGIGRKIPLVSGRRAAAVRAGTQFRNCCQPIDASRQVKWEERGQDATADDAKGALRYAVAAQMSYLTENNFNRKNMGSSQNYEDFTLISKNFWQEIPPNSIKGQRRVTARFQSMQSAYADNMTHRQGQGWNFQPIGRYATADGGIGRAIFNKLPDSLRRSVDADGSFHDPHTGNRIMLHYDVTNNEVVMAFSGTGSSHKYTSLNQDLGNIANYLGGVPPSLEQAVAVGKAVRDAVAEYNGANPHQQPIGVVSTGHSRGGLQATVEAIKNGGKAETFNPEAMGGGVREYCGILRSDRLPPGVEITNHSVVDDFASGSAVGSGIGNAWETVTGLPAPFIPGRRLVYAKGKGAPGSHPDPITHVACRAGGGSPPSRLLPPRRPPHPVPPPPNLARA